MKMNLWFLDLVTAQEMHRRWFESHLGKLNVKLHK